jgi:hypothetical protein
MVNEAISRHRCPLPIATTAIVPAVKCAGPACVAGEIAGVLVPLGRVRV